MIIPISNKLFFCFNCGSIVLYPIFYIIVYFSTNALNYNINVTNLYVFNYLTAVIVLRCIGLYLFNVNYIFRHQCHSKSILNRIQQPNRANLC